MICSQLAGSPLPNLCNDGSVIRIVDPRPSYCNVLKKLCVSIPSHAVIWLGLVPLSPPPLPPSPSPASLSTIPPALKVLSGDAGESDLVEQIHYNLLPFGARGPKVDIQIPEQQRVTVRRTFVSGRTEVVHSRHVRGRDVGPHYVKSNSPHDQLEGQDIQGDDGRRLD